MVHNHNATQDNGCVARVVTESVVLRALSLYSSCSLASQLSFESSGELVRPRGRAHEPQGLM